MAFVDPGDGAVLGTTTPGGLFQTIRSLHSLAITGWGGQALIEIAAGWAILLVASGFYLWWPRANPAIALRGSPGKRLFWRDLHASSGAVAGVILLFLAVTGMPWSVLWGKTVRGWVTEAGIGRPALPHSHAGPHDGMAMASLPWAMRDMAMPRASAGADIGATRALAIAGGRGLSGGWTLTLPTAPGKPYLFSATAPRAEDARVLAIDPATGGVLQDAGARQFGVGARAIEWGIGAHQGQEYGEPNRLLMLAGCLATLLLAVSGLVMVAKRGFRVPPPPADRRIQRNLALLMLGAGLLYPLTGLSMLVALAGERIVSRRRLA